MRKAQVAKILRLVVSKPEMNRKYTINLMNLVV